MKILVLDDFDDFRNEIVEILVRNGHTADGAASATEAVARIENGDYDLVLADYNMPEHDGLWFMKNVKRARSTKVLLITAHVDRGIIDEMFRSGAAGYIIKPFEEAELLQHIGFHFHS
jgi:two-component system chemotaxis response regulator CheY